MGCTICENCGGRATKYTRTRPKQKGPLFGGHSYRVKSFQVGFSLQQVPVVSARTVCRIRGRALNGWEANGRFAPIASELFPRPFHLGSGQETTVEESPCASLRISYSLRYSFPKVARRIAPSIVLLSALLAGTITPTGVCAFLCERHARSESQRHCSQPPDAMPGMAHDHSVMNHAGVEAMSAAFASQSCQLNCITAERLAAWRKAVPQATVVQTGVVVLETAARFLPPDPAGALTSDGGPPVPPTERSAFFSILRI